MTFGATKQQRQRRLTRLTMAVTSAAVAALLPLSTGCDDPHQADRRVRDAIVDARHERAKGTPEAREAAQKKLQEAAAEADAGVATQAHAKAMLAQGQYEAALAEIAHPLNGIDATNREIIRLIREINQLGQQIDTTNGLVQVYKQMEPKEARSAVQQRILEATGDQSKTAWVGEGEAAVPTLTAVQQQVEQQQAAVNKQDELIKGLQAKQEQVTAQAAQADSQANRAQGRAGLDLFKQAVGLRKQAADIATQIDAENAKLAQLTHDLKLAQARQQAVATAIQQFQQVGQNLEQGWKGVEAQATQQQQLAQQILKGGGDNKSTTSLAAKAKQLREQIDANKGKYDTAQQNLTDAVDNYGKAVSAARQLGSEISSKGGGLPSDNQMKVALDTLGKVFHPGTFELGQATAQLALANLQVSRAQTLNERARLVDGLSKTLSAAGLAMPQELNDPALAGQLKETTEEANKNYAAALELFGTASDGGGGDAVKNGGQSGKIYALYGQALLARASGGDAKEQLAAATSARDLVLTDSPGALNALPAELVPPPSTQPAAGAATTTATTPAEGAAPAEGTPATTPAEGTTAPAEGGTTAPAEGAAPPAEGAAPATPPADGAAPATPPADGTAPATPPADGAAPATPPAEGTPPTEGAAPADGAAPATPGTDTPAPAPQ
jgi:hypothetical protein